MAHTWRVYVALVKKKNLEPSMLEGWWSALPRRARGGSQLVVELQCCRLVLCNCIAWADCLVTGGDSGHYSVTCSSLVLFFYYSSIYVSSRFSLSFFLILLCLYVCLSVVLSVGLCLSPCLCICPSLRVSVSHSLSLSLFISRFLSLSLSLRLILVCAYTKNPWEGEGT